MSAIVLFMAGIAAIAGWWLSQQGLAAKPCAVLGPPDGQELYDQWEAYDGFVESADTLMIADAPEEGPAWMLSLENRWFQCMVRHLGGPLWMTDATDGIRAGMSTRPNGLSNGLSRRRSARVLTTFARVWMELRNLGQKKGAVRTIQVIGTQLASKTCCNRAVGRVELRLEFSPAI